MTEQQEHLTTASAEIEPCTAIAVDLQHPLKEFRVEGSLETLASGQEGWKPPALLAAPGWRMGLRPLGIWKLYFPLTVLSSAL